MSKQFIQMTSGWIPVAVMVLLAIALIAGQARANLPSELRAAPIPAAATSVKIVLSTQLLKKLDHLPTVVDTLLDLPQGIELRIDTRILRGDLAHENVSPLRSK